MHITTDIARRYLFGKKSTNAINWISRIVILGMTIGTAAMIILMSVFNGFEGLLSNLFNAYNPDFKVYPKEGLYLDISEDQIISLKSIPEIQAVARTIQEVALFEYDGSQEAGYIKGVDESYTEVSNIDSIIVRGDFKLKDGAINLGVLGIGMFNKLSVNPSDGLTPITVYMPKRKKRGPLDTDYKALSIYAKGVFSVGNEDDTQVIISNFEFVNKLLDKDGAISYLEIKSSPDADENIIRDHIERVIGSGINVKNRYQQDEAYLRIMNIEKWVTFLIVALTILIISFNLVGSLWMIVLDKKKDISILRSMGMTPSHITKIFIQLGLLMGVVGMVLGMIISLILYALQVSYGLVSVPSGFLIESYPIALKWTDFLVAGSTVLIISFLASIFPALKTRNITSAVNSE